MKLVRNTGTDRVIDLIRPGIGRGHRLDMLTPALSLFAFSEVNREVRELEGCRLVLPPNDSDLALLGTAADRPARNRLQSRWLAKRLLQWIESKAEVRRALAPIPQSAFVIRNSNGHPEQALLGSLAFSTDGLGLTPGNPMSLIQASETPEEASLLSQWFDAQWSALAADPASKTALIDSLKKLAGNRDPWLVYALVLYHIFRDRGDQLEKNTAIKVYAKLPGWFTVPTPLGSYNPDWAVLVEQEGEERLYFVVETKATLLFADALRPTEQAKIACGREHFKALEVRESPARYVVTSSVEELLTRTQ